MAMMPILKNSQAVITTFSRRRAMSQRIVASESVTEIGTQIDSDQDRVRYNACLPRVLNRGTAHQTHG